MSGYKYISDNKSLLEAVEMMRREKIIAVDTEFMREKTYYPLLSLIQVAVKNANESYFFIIDALVEIDLQPFFDIIFDRDIIKIFHAALQDLQIIAQKSQKLSPNFLDDLSASVVDTQIMSNFCGMNFNSGYSALVEKFFQQNIDKTLQRSNWQKRPLSEEQLDYAISDVLFLHEIYHKLLEELKEKNREQWFFEEMRSFIKNTFKESGENLFKKFSFRGRSKEEIATLKNLILWRENWAQKLDIPRQHFIRDHVLERVAYSKDFNLKLSQHQISEMKEIVEQKNGFMEADSPRSENSFMNSKQKELYKKAKELMVEVSNEQQIREQILLPNHNLKSLVCGKKTMADSIAKWRYQLYGKRLEKIIYEK